MANSTVTDALFMANVSKQLNVMESTKKLQAEGATFAQTMSDASAQNLKIDTNLSNDTFKSSSMQGGGRTAVDQNRNTVRNGQDDDKNVSADNSRKTQTDMKSDNDEETAPGRTEAAAKETVKDSEDIKDEIKEKLDVSDEDIEKAMENLGLSAQDLFDQDSLKNLMMELGGCEDSLELLTNADLYQGMQDVLNDVQEMTDSIISEYGLTDEDFSAMLDNDELFDKITQEAGLDTGKDAFGPFMENEAFQAEAPEIAPGDGRAADMKNMSSEDNGHRVKVEVVGNENGNVDKAASDQSKTETFRNISQSEKSQSNNNEGMANMTQQTTSITVNELGEVVETVERFTSAFSDAKEIMSQVTESIKLNVSSDTTSMEMMLHPASLGTVNMQISSHNGVVTAHILVQNEAVKAALESQMAQLQETFEEQGQTVEAVEVSVAGYDLDKSSQQQMRDEQEREKAFGMGKSARRRLRLDDISEENIDELDDDERISADMMRREGNSLDFMA